MTGRGTASPNYGTHRTHRVDGYIRVWRPGHPMANGDGYGLEHRVVLYDAGAAVPQGCAVHHKNGDRTDNSLANLEIMTLSEHTSLHAKRRDPRVCETCGNTYQPGSRKSRFCSRGCANRRIR